MIFHVGQGGEVKEEASRDIGRHDERACRCPMLGHQVRFAYCRKPASDQPCRRIFDCWWEIFDVVSYMKERLSKEQFETLAARKPRPKVLSIVEMVREIQRRQDDE